MPLLVYFICADGHFADPLEDGVLYVAMEYRTAVLKCFCDCRSEVATALSSKDWKLTYDGVSMLLYPSMGNWALDSQSQYWIDYFTLRSVGLAFIGIILQEYF